MKYTVLVARILFSSFFIMMAFKNFSQDALSWGTQAGVPSPTLIMPLFGLLTLAGGLSILLGYHGRFGAWILVVLLVLSTLFMHNWSQNIFTGMGLSEIMFWKNISLLGGALLFTHCGTGPYSVK